MSTWINGQASSVINIADRGLAYGDGIFRTIKIRDGLPCAWPWQWQALCDDARALLLPVPDELTVYQEIVSLAAGIALGIAKVMLTRGLGQRGYGFDDLVKPTRVVSVHAWDEYDPKWQQSGIAMTLCQTRLGIQPRLAGVKHLNRLENVLARTEWLGKPFQEGLLLDLEDNVIEGCISNVFIVKNSIILTPCIENNGIHGMTRRVLLQENIRNGHPIVETRLGIRDIIDADEVFLSNSLIGVWPVASFEGRVWHDFSIAHAQLQILQQADAYTSHN